MPLPLLAFVFISPFACATVDVAKAAAGQPRIEAQGVADYDQTIAASPRVMLAAPTASAH